MSLGCNSKMAAAAVCMRQVHFKEGVKEKQCKGQNGGEMVRIRSMVRIGHVLIEP